MSGDEVVTTGVARREEGLVLVANASLVLMLWGEMSDEPLQAINPLRTSAAEAPTSSGNSPVLAGKVMHQVYVLDSAASSKAPES